MVKKMKGKIEEKQQQAKISRKHIVKLNKKNDKLIINRKKP